MSDPIEISLILGEVWRAGIELKVNSTNDKVVLTGPPSLLTIALLGRIRENKDAIIKRLREIERVVREIHAPHDPDGGNVA